MKLFTDMSTSVKGSVELNESSNEKVYVIKGIFSSPGLKNRNGRIYPQDIWESNVQRYQEEIRNNTVNTLAELEHPPRSTVNPWEAVAKTRLLEMRDGKVYGEMEILNNNSEKTNQLKALIEAGVSIGVSTRGVGRLGKGQIVEEYQLITTDIVANPSDYGANLVGFTESMILESEEFSIQDGKVVCTPTGCSIVESDGETECSKKAKQLKSILEEFTKEEQHLSEKEKLALKLLGKDIQEANNFTDTFKTFSKTFLNFADIVNKKDSEKGKKLRLMYYDIKDLIKESELSEAEEPSDDFSEIAKEFWDGVNKLKAYAKKDKKVYDQLVNALSDVDDAIDQLRK